METKWLVALVHGESRGEVGTHKVCDPPPLRLELARNASWNDAAYCSLEAL
jgi:hypothetical protein